MSSHFKTLQSKHIGYWMIVILLAVMALAGYGAAHYMEVQGHWVTGMNNQVVWGLPHVFAIFLILAASGALNVASISSVFGRKVYKPWSRLSALLAVCLLVAGLIVLVLDLGRPERLIVAMTHYNFKSIFAWNIFLYTGFVLVVAGYLWTMFERGMNHHTSKAGVFAFAWRFVLTSGTGSIFGFLVARQFYDAAMMVPMFIVLSLILGTAIFILLSLLLAQWSQQPVLPELLERLASLLAIFIVLELFLVTVFHFTNLYATEHHGIERFILIDGGIYTFIFWVGQIFLGGVVPAVLVFLSAWGQSPQGIKLVAILAVLGAMSQLYVTIIGGQAYPLVLFPGKEVSSTFYDGVVAQYSPSMPELLLGVGGVALAVLLVILATRILPFMPDDRVSRSAS
ncbi:MAG: NrfD/PsrC family molybdoenzyme membrane anchor subunit [Arenicellales bacterium]